MTVLPGNSFSSTVALIFLSLRFYGMVHRVFFFFSVDLYGDDKHRLALHDVYVCVLNASETALREITSCGACFSTSTALLSKSSYISKGSEMTRSRPLKRARPVKATY